MMAVRKHQDIVQWSYQRVPLNVVPRIPLLGYPSISIKGTFARSRSERNPQIGTFPWGKGGLYSARNADYRTGLRPSMATAKPIVALVSYRERSKVSRQFDRAGVSADEEAFGVDRARGG